MFNTRHCTLKSRHTIFPRLCEKSWHCNSSDIDKTPSHGPHSGYRCALSHTPALKCTRDTTPRAVLYSTTPPRHQLKLPLPTPPDRYLTRSDSSRGPNRPNVNSQATGDSFFWVVLNDPIGTPVSSKAQVYERSVWPRYTRKQPIDVM